MKLLKTWMTALCLAFAVLLMQGGTALAALYQGDIGETRFTTPEGTYILKRYAPPQGGASGASSSSGSSGGGLTVVPPTPQQGRYEIVDEAQSGWDVTFDFDHSRTFTIYNEAGPTQRIQYRPGGASVYVTNLVDKDSIFDGEYERQESGDFIAYIPGVGERKLPPYIMAALRIVLDNSVAGLEQGITYPYTSQVPNVGTQWNFTLRKTQPQQLTEIETTPNAAPQTNTASPPKSALYMIVNSSCARRKRRQARRRQAPRFPRATWWSMRTTAPSGSRSATIRRRVCSRCISLRPIMVKSPMRIAGSSLTAELKQNSWTVMLAVSIHRMAVGNTGLGLPIFTVTSPTA